MMRTWSLEETLIRAQSAVAVAMQGVWDVFTHRPAYSNDHPIPGCPSPSDCRGFGCAGDCSEAGEAPGYTEEVSEPRPPGFYTMMDPEWADLHYGFPYPPADKEHHIASDGGEWVFNNLGGGEWDAISYPPSGDPYMEVKRREREAAYEDEVPNPTEPSLSDDELVAVRGLIQERYDPISSPAAGARAAGSSPSEVSGHSPRLPSEGCPDLSRPWQIADLTEHYTTLAVPGERPWGITDSLGRVIARIETQAHAEAVVAAVNTDPSRGNRLASVRGEGSPADSGIPRPPAGERPELDWHGWAEPAVMEVLSEHRVINNKVIDGATYCCDADGAIHAEFGTTWEWAEHVATPIASRLACDPARAIAALHNHKPQ